MADRLAVPREPRRPVGHEPLALLLTDRQADVGARVAAVLALAALRREERDHVIARRDRRNALADPLDDAGSLVAEHSGRVSGRIGSRGGVQVGVTDPAGDEPDEHLARARPGEVELLHLERRAEPLEHGGADLHRPILR
jgi:hypothetical protein